MDPLKKFKIIRSVVFAVLSVIILVSYSNAITIISYSMKDETEKADVIIVLGAATYDGEVSAVYKGRIDRSISLYKDGYAKKIIMTGGIGSGNETSDAFAAKRYAVSKGIPEEDILLEEKSKITDQNLRFAKEIMDKEGMETALIVSDPLHMKRAMLLAKDNGITAFSSPADKSMYKTAKTKTPFLLRETFFFTGYKIVRIFR